MFIFQLLNGIVNCIEVTFTSFEFNKLKYIEKQSMW